MSLIRIDPGCLAIWRARSSPDSYVDQIGHEAAKFLTEFSAEEIDELAQAFADLREEQIEAHGDVFSEEGTPVAALSLEPSADVVVLSCTTIADLVLLARDRAELSISTDLEKDFTWPQLFAACALDACSLFHEMCSVSAGRQWDTERLTTLGNAASEAGIALSLAHEIARWDKLDIGAIIRRQRSAHATQAATTRHAPASTLKAQFEAFADSNPGLSAREAARRFFLALDDNEKMTVSPSREVGNGVRVLTDALRERRKNRDVEV